MIYIISKNGKVLMPTKRYGHIRKLLKQNKAVVINNNPFTVRLKYDTTNITQSLILGIDSGRENIGLSVSDQNGTNLFNANVITNNKQIKKNMQERKEHRSARRRHRRIRKQRKAIRDNVIIQNGSEDILRSKKECKSINISYPGMDKSITCKVIRGKESKFNNRKRKDGWITPSARNLVQIYINLVKKIQKFLPITNIVIERNCFDFQKLENQDINKWEYSKGPLYSFKDYKDFIYQQQEGKCLLCGKKIEYYHHITYRSNDGVDNVKNIAGLCRDCHEEVHSSAEYENRLLELKQDLSNSYKVSLLNSCMDIIIDELNNILPVKITTGYETYKLREKLGLDKDHYIDAYIISLYDREIDNIKLNTDNIYTIRHFKKKSNNIIHTLGRREYYYNGKLVAINRNKAFNQKEDSLTEYKNKYLETHSQEELEKHLFKLAVKPVKRTYTIHKEGKKSKFKVGDKIKYIKKNKIKGNTKQKVFVAEGLDNSNNKIRYNKTKNCDFKYCSIIESNSLVFI